ncbi:pyridoxal phosphate-dependent aminotransferase [Candidatus Caldatribacterium sp.]|uniref:pyridoxal phosphate-dependent aminotransferase n=1 Tax=Candidatus Caldatribacterium sp. TaxID=2282143 RepID=UPI0029985766|nr:pyridoxal phosphate-dependent aminotransferase [Candidatus Caldatribacterium sp.]MDW8081565.1 pyridoxal phosphate-dependent aminotransferase [Candidatus Calescibacterium sp.]
MFCVPDCILDLPRSGIRELMGMALAMPQAIRLEMGEPHFPTPRAILEKLKDFFFQGEIRYTPTVGIPSLRAKIVEKLRREKHWNVSLDAVIVLPGSLFGTVTVFRTILEPGDEVLVPDPGFTNHFCQVLLCGGRTVHYHLRPENNYLPDFQEIRRSITSKTRAILVNSPSNPLGVVFPGDVLEEIGRLAEEYDLLVVSDEAYEKYVYKGKHLGLFQFVNPERLVTIFSFSKTYALTGWRVGYMVVPEKLAPHFAKVAEYLIACTSHLSQKAAEIALDLPDEEIQKMVDYYRENVEIASRILREGGFTFFEPQGGYYIWVDVREFGMPSLEFCKTFLQEKGVALAPGDTFGESGEGFVRISICRKREDVAEGVRRLVAWRRERG